MLIKLQESLSEHLQTFLATYFAKNNISQSFTIEFHGDNDCGLDLVFAEGPLECDVYMPEVNDLLELFVKFDAVNL